MNMRLGSVTLVSLVLVACSSSEASTPLDVSSTEPLLPVESEVILTPAAPPPATPALDGNVDVITLDDSLLEGDDEIRTGPVEIGETCAEYLQPARDMLEDLRSGTTVTEEDSLWLQEHITGALDVCTGDEYVAFQMEVFPAPVEP